MSDWNELETLWRSNEPPELDDLRGRLRRQTLVIRAWFASELAIGAAAAALGSWLIISGELTLIGAGIVAFAIFATLTSWRAWRGAWRVETGTPGQTVAAGLARNAAVQRYLNANYYVSIPAVALIGAMVATDSFDAAGDPARLERALFSITAAFGVLVVWLAGCGLYAGRLARERERLIALGRELGVPT